MHLGGEGRKGEALASELIFVGTPSKTLQLEGLGRAKKIVKGTANSLFRGGNSSWV